MTYDEAGELKPVSQMPRGLRDRITSIDVVEQYQGSGKERKFVGYTHKIRLADPLRARELIGKHVDVSAYRENIAIQNEDGLVERIMAARRRARANGHDVDDSDPETLH